MASVTLLRVIEPTGICYCNVLVPWGIRTGMRLKGVGRDTDVTGLWELREAGEIKKVRDLSNQASSGIFRHDIVYGPEGWSWKQTSS